MKLFSIAALTFAFATHALASSPTAIECNLVGPTTETRTIRILPRDPSLPHELPAPLDLGNGVTVYSRGYAPMVDGLGFAVHVQAGQVGLMVMRGSFGPAPEVIRPTQEMSIPLPTGRLRVTCSAVYGG